MSSNYTPDPTATQAPALVPQSDGNPIVVLPSDGDAANVASIHQAFKVLGDHIAWLFKPRAKAASFSQWIQTWRTALLHKRFTIDHMGLPAGRILAWLEQWRIQGTLVIDTGIIPNVIGWSFFTLNGSAAWGAISRVRLVILNVAAAVGNYATLTHLPESKFGAEKDIALEFTASLEVANSADTSYFLGFRADADLFADPAPSNADAYVWFVKEAGTANWFAMCRDGAGSTSVDTGVVPVTGTASEQRFRIEWHGSTVADDSTSRILFFIDGVQVANITTNLPTVANLNLPCPTFAMENTVGAGNKEMYLGPVRCSANIFGSDVV